MGQTSGLGFQVTGLHIIGLLPVGLHEIIDLLSVSCFGRGSCWPYSWDSNNHRAETSYFLGHTTISALSSSALYWGQAVCWTICSNCKKYNFFRILGVAWFSALVRPTLMVSGTTRKHIRHIVPWKINLCFSPSYHLKKFGHGVFPHLVETQYHSHTT